jgi:hypothetical protein
VPDAIFEDPRLAEIYDPLDPDRRDLDAYVAMAAEFGAESVVDVGCGTGTLACLLAGVTGNLVCFRMTFLFEPDGTVLTSDSTLRFRSRDELADSLAAVGLTAEEVRDAPDRPGREFVFIARRTA